MGEPPSVDVPSRSYPREGRRETVCTVGHGARAAEELVETLVRAGVRTLVDVRRFPGSRRHPHFGRDALAATLAATGIGYRHAVELGGRRAGEPGEERFGCVRTPAFRSYAARMGTPGWQAALTEALTAEAPCFMCAETLWWRCHRRLIAELLHARGTAITHLLAPGKGQAHRPFREAETRDGSLYLCGARVA
jgi:uncharacterized protein (DUF488 family)